MNFRRLALSSAVFFLSAAAWTGASRAAFEGDLASPHRIVLTLTADPAHSQAVTWRAAAKAARPRAQIAVASANPSFGRAAVTTAGKATGVDSAGTTGTYAAVFLGLNPDTAYSYRVGDGDRWSEWNLFHTASEKADPFSFLYFGDAQNNIASLWSQVVRSAVFRNPQARFLVHAGDLVSEGHDERLWDEWTAALGFLASMIPSLPVPGNHDLHRPGRDTLSAPLPWNRIFRPVLRK
jgi:phosphodiesterase/alkaline phosphatase D-like protein